MKGPKGLGGGGVVRLLVLFLTQEKGVSTTPYCLGVELIMILDPIRQKFLFVGSVFSFYHNLFSIYHVK